MLSHRKQQAVDNIAQSFIFSRKISVLSRKPNRNSLFCLRNRAPPLAHRDSVVGICKSREDMSTSGQHQFRYTQTPSKVLHLRNLPWECIEEELVELCKPFGKIVNTKCNVGANRNQAFVEFVTSSSLSFLPCLTASNPSVYLRLERYQGFQSCIS